MMGIVTLRSVVRIKEMKLLCFASIMSLQVQGVCVGELLTVCPPLSARGAQ